MTRRGSGLCLSSKLSAQDLQWASAISMSVSTDASLTAEHGRKDLQVAVMAKRQAAHDVESQQPPAAARSTKSSWLQARLQQLRRAPAVRLARDSRAPGASGHDASTAPCLPLPVRRFAHYQHSERSLMT